MADDREDQDLHSLTAEIVSTFVGNNAVAIGDLPAIITSVFGALHGVGQEEAEPPPEVLQPAVPIKKSLREDYLICLEDGRKMKMLKRYLATRYNLTPEQYRQRWGLPKTYPMVAPGYAVRRSEVAKQFGLGRKRGAAAPTPAPVSTPAAPEPRGQVGGRRKNT
jgi:predicted transcriptional regulator